MAKLNGTLIVFIVFAVFVAIGGSYVYLNENGSHTADAHMNADGTIDYSIGGPSSNYGYSVFTETNVCEKIYLYYDENYASEFNDRYTQDEYFNVLRSMLERRGASVERVNSVGLPALMNDTDIAIVFVSGSLPDTVYNGTEDSAFVDWMKNGGTVYWSGPEIGRYISSETGVTDLGTGFFGGEVNSNDKETMYAYNESEMFVYTQMRHDDCSYGIKADRLNSVPLSFVSDEGYSSVSVVKLFNGNAFIFGGNIAETENVSQVVTDRTCCADLIICGLTYESEGLEHNTGHFKGSVSASTNVDVSPYTNVSVWLYTGMPATDWGRCFTVN